MENFPKMAWWKIGHCITLKNCNKLQIGKLEKSFKFPNKEDKWKIAKKNGLVDNWTPHYLKKLQENDK